MLLEDLVTSWALGLAPHPGQVLAGKGRKKGKDSRGCQKVAGHPALGVPPAEFLNPSRSCFGVSPRTP